MWNNTLDDIVKGFKDCHDGKECIICSQRFENGRIYELDGSLYDSEGAIREHLRQAHGGIAGYLLSGELNLTGISEIQRSILQMTLSGSSDKEISAKLGIAASTVRNHRFKLREREKQAKLFLALAMCIEKETKKGLGKSAEETLIEVPKTARMVDDRFDITDRDREKAIKTYMDKNGALKQFPVKEKKKIIVLSEIIKCFKSDTKYSEKEVNRTLSRIYEQDYPTLRRALIEYGFMDRTADGSVYRVKE